MHARTGLAGAASLVLGLAALRPALGADITFYGTHPTLPLAASATFSASGTDLLVTLTNTAPYDVLFPHEVLTALYFDVGGATMSLTPVSAVVPAGSTILFPPATPFDPLPDGVGGEWEYREGVTNAPFGQRYVISSAGLGLSSTSSVGLFQGANLQGPQGVNGLQYGITSAGDNPATGNSTVTGGGGALIKNQVLFTLSGLPAGFDPMAQVSNVQWQYGTTRCDVAGTVDRCVPDVPEPRSSALVALLGAASICRLQRRRTR